MLSNTTIKRLRKIQGYILNEAMTEKRSLGFNMHTYCSNDPGETGTTSYCNMVGCIGGTAIFLFNPKNFKSNLPCDIESSARKVLRLTKEQAGRLFYFTSWGHEVGWPSKNEREYYRANSDTARAVAAYNRIERFIDTQGKE